MLKKHAYLIIAHNEYEILKKLIKVLDDERNDIYIHIDKKSKSFKKLKTELVSCYSNIFFTKRINVTWGGDSQIKCELLLLEEAFKIGYEYYHLISGVDFPNKPKIIFMIISINIPTIIYVLMEKISEMNLHKKELKNTIFFKI